jgi:hypothetical protein
MVRDTIYTRPGRPLIERKIVLPEGVYHEVDDHTKSVSTFHYAANDPKFLGRRLMKRDVSTECAKPLDGGSTETIVAREIVGQTPAVKFIEKGAEFERSVWMAPSLGCITLMQRHDWGDQQAPNFSSSFSAPDYLKLSEPDDNLFQIPADYQEVIPSERHRRTVAYLDIVESAREKAAADAFGRIADAAYAMRNRR